MTTTSKILTASFFIASMVVIVNCGGGGADSGPSIGAGGGGPPPPAAQCDTGGPSANDLNYFKALNGQLIDHYGNAIQLSGDGNTMVVGAPFEDSDAKGIFDLCAGATPAYNHSNDYSGSVYVYVQENGIWMQTTYIKAPDGVLYDLFGNALALSRDGMTLAVAAPGRNEGNVV